MSICKFNLDATTHRLYSLIGKFRQQMMIEYLVGRGFPDDIRDVVLEIMKIMDFGVFKIYLEDVKTGKIIEKAFSVDGSQITKEMTRDQVLSNLDYHNLNQLLLEVVDNSFACISESGMSGSCKPVEDEGDDIVFQVTRSGQPIKGKNVYVGFDDPTEDRDIQEANLLPVFESIVDAIREVVVSYFTWLEIVTDELTGAYNRKYFQKLLKAGTFWKGYYLVSIDMDHFKSVNDKYGHDNGDIVLKELVRIILSLIRPDDFFFRVGGEEFLLFVRADRISAALMAAERVRAAVQQYAFQLQANDKTAAITIYKTLSIGVVKIYQGRTFEQLSSKADAALYQAKEGGRNQIILATPRRFFKVVFRETGFSFLPSQPSDHKEG